MVYSTYTKAVIVDLFLYIGSDSEMRRKQTRKKSQFLAYDIQETATWLALMSGTTTSVAFVQSQASAHVEMLHGL